MAQSAAIYTTPTPLSPFTPCGPITRHRNLTRTGRYGAHTTTDISRFLQRTPYLRLSPSKVLSITG